MFESKKFVLNMQFLFISMFKEQKIFICWIFEFSLVVIIISYVFVRRKSCVLTNNLVIKCTTSFVKCVTTYYELTKLWHFLSSTRWDCLPSRTRCRITVWRLKSPDFWRSTPCCRFNFDRIRMFDLICSRRQASPGHGQWHQRSDWDEPEHGPYSGLLSGEIKFYSHTL